MSESGGSQNRGPALSALMLFTLSMMILFGAILLVLFIITLTYPDPTLTWYLVPLWIPFTVGAGAYVAATFDTRQKARIFAQASVIAAVLNALGLIFNIIAGYYYSSLWVRCVLSIGSLDTLEEIMCSDENWVVWITAVWSWVFIFAALGAFITAGYDAFVRITRSNIFNMAQQGFERTSDVFGRGFQKAFSSKRRFRTEGEEGPTDFPEEGPTDLPEEGEDLYPSQSRYKRDNRYRNRNRNGRNTPSRESFKRGNSKRQHPQRGRRR